MLFFTQLPLYPQDRQVKQYMYILYFFLDIINVATTYMSSSSSPGSGYSSVFSSAGCGSSLLMCSENGFNLITAGIDGVICIINYINRV
jgi:hypothetical protein